MALPVNWKMRRAGMRRASRKGRSTKRQQRMAAMNEVATTAIAVQPVRAASVAYSVKTISGQCHR